MYYLLILAFGIETSVDRYLFPCFVIFGLFGFMLSLTALIPRRHLLEAVLLFSQDACVVVDLSAGALVLYFIAIIVFLWQKSIENQKP